MSGRKRRHHQTNHSSEPDSSGDERDERDERDGPVTDSFLGKLYGKKACRKQETTKPAKSAADACPGDKKPACPQAQKQPACPPPKPACPAPPKPACPAPKPAAACPPRQQKREKGACGPKPKPSGDAKCRRSSRRARPKQPRSRNPFIIFFLEMWFKRPCGRVANVAVEAGKKWQCLGDKEKDCYRKLARIEQMKQKRRACGPKRKKPRRNACKSKKRRPRRPKRKC